MDEQFIKEAPAILEVGYKERACFGRGRLTPIKSALNC